MSSKKKRNISFDEYFSNEQFEMGRMGNIVTTKNHLSADAVYKRNIELSSQYEEKNRKLIIRLMILLRM